MLGDELNHRVTLRLNENQYKFLIAVSKTLGVSPSDYIRMCLNAGMVTVDKNLLEKGGNDANVKTDLNNIL